MSNEDLFNNRKLIGKLLSCSLSQSSLSKSSLCKRAGISRPTLNRILRGEVTSQTNFITHLMKLLPALDLTIKDLFEKNKASSAEHEKGPSPASDDFNESVIEIRLQNGKKALFRGCVAFPDEESGKIRWQEILDIEGDHIMAVLSDGTRIQIGSS